MFLIQDQRVQEFVTAWQTAWNSHDVERLMEFYDEKVFITAPLIRGHYDFVSKSTASYTKTDFALYCQEIFTQIPNFKIEVLAVAVGVNAITIHYTGLNEVLFAETIVLGENFKISQSCIYY